jgi:hypothetical protein
MKHIVFDNWLLMAIATSCPLRIRALDQLSLLIPGEDFLGAAFSTHPPPRRSRPIDARICALKSSSILPSRSPLPQNLHTLHTLTTHMNERTSERNETRDAMILTKLSKAQRGNTQGSNPHMNTHLGTKPLKFCIA